MNLDPALCELRDALRKKIHHYHTAFFKSSTEFQSLADTEFSYLDLVTAKNQFDECSSHFQNSLTEYASALQSTDRDPYFAERLRFFHQINEEVDFTYSQLAKRALEHSARQSASGVTNSFSPDTRVLLSNVSQPSISNLVRLSTAPGALDRNPEPSSVQNYDLVGLANLSLSPSRVNSRPQVQAFLPEPPSADIRPHRLFSSSTIPDHGDAARTDPHPPAFYTSDRNPVSNDDKVTISCQQTHANTTATVTFTQHSSNFFGVPSRETMGAKTQTVPSTAHLGGIMQTDQLPHVETFLPVSAPQSHRSPVYREYNSRPVFCPESVHSGSVRPNALPFSSLDLRANPTVEKTPDTLSILEREVALQREKLRLLKETAAFSTPPTPTNPNVPSVPHVSQSEPVSDPISSSLSAGDLLSHQRDMMVALLRKNYQESDGEKFDGNSLKYAQFRHRFDNNTRKLVTDPGSCLEILLNSCTGPARKSIDFVTLEPDPAVGLEKALSILESDFGAKHKVASAQLKAITDGPKVPSTEQGMQNFLCDLRNCRQVMKVSNKLGELNVAGNLEPIYQRLPPHVQRKFRNEISEKFGGEPNFDHLLDLVAQEQRSLASPVGQWASSAPKKAVEHNRSPKPTHHPYTRVNATSAKTSGPPTSNHARSPRPLMNNSYQPRSSSYNRPSQQYQVRSAQSTSCELCQGHHQGLETCPVFTQASWAERYQIAKELRLCFKCLKLGHSIRNCHLRSQCSVQGCHFPNSHHTLLHRHHAAPQGLSQQDFADPAALSAPKTPHLPGASSS